MQAHLERLESKIQVNQKGLGGNLQGLKENIEKFEAQLVDFQKEAMAGFTIYQSYVSLQDMLSGVSAAVTSSFKGSRNLP